jgi:hypothetical protein
MKTAVGRPNVSQEPHHGSGIKLGRWFDIVDKILQFFNLRNPDSRINEVKGKPAVILPRLHLHGSTSLSIHEAEQQQRRVNLTRIKNFFIIKSLSHNSKVLVKGTYGMKRFWQEDILAFPRSPRREILRNGRSLRLKLRTLLCPIEFSWSPHGLHMELWSPCGVHVESMRTFP